MGQRLNLEIMSSDEVLANAYYHWSAYTGSSADLMMQVLKGMASFRGKDMEPIVVAVKLLESTGAGTNANEIELIKKEVEKKHLPKELAKYKYKPCVNRNEGIISVSRAGIDDTRSWAEGTVQIDLDTGRVNFAVLWEITKEDCDSEEEYKERIADAYELDYDLADMSTEEATDFAEVVHHNIVTYKDKTGTYYSTIY